MYSNDILVSVRCAVYNHGPYLRQCLDGFIMQKTNFRFEVIVHDDASTDNSACIIREYAEKYPDIIKPIYQTENQYSKSKSSVSRIINKACQGKYYASCEGDDYWIDPLKLQKQVDYMESHPECALCFGSALEHWEGTDRPDSLFAGGIEDRDYDPDETCNGWLVATATVLFRKTVINTDLYKRYTNNRRIITGDLPLWLTCATVGTLHGFSDVFSVYRRLPSGFMLKMRATNRIAMGDHRVEIYRVFGKKYKNSTLQMAMVHYRLAISYALQEKDWKSLMFAIYKSIAIRVLHPIITIRHVEAILKQRKERLSA